MTQPPSPPVTPPSTPQAAQAAVNRRFAMLGLLLSGVFLIGIIALLLLRAALDAPIEQPLIPGITPIDPPRAVSDFTLPSTRGDLSLSDLRGKHTLLFFGYTNCPDFCPMTLSEYNQVFSILGPTYREQVNIVFVSVDGERDTPDALMRYLSRFDRANIGMSGDPVTLARITPDYGLYYQLNKKDDADRFYTVDHSTPSYLIDPQGRLTHIFSFSAEIDDLVETLRSVLG